MKTRLVLFLTLFSIISFSQKSEKIKGSKIVTITQRELINFKELELLDKLDVILIKGTTCNLEIEADDNLHETFIVTNTGKKTTISNNSNISRSKKMLLKVTYNDSLKTLIIKNDVKVTGIEDITNDGLTINSYDDSDIKIGINNKNLNIIANNDSELELSVKTENLKINALDSSEIEGNFSIKTSVFNLIEKSSIKIDGSTDDLKINTKDSSNFSGKNFAVSNGDVNSKNKSEVIINCKNNLNINATNDSKIVIYSTPKIILETFDGNSTLQKKSF